ncbi:uncharacterized protein LOC128874721 [Hylaeus volcanicus]|uniref:uncharacterized protein LOC128874721 n=1 Tax=Hylaeus volcanicus TaxID=313075 RepID=UPI0023B865EF|nr:uncharacterized protein LOC128874721 [Hylaeus volcanicus]
MGLTAAWALCDCNGTGRQSQNSLECQVSAKKVVSKCTPALKAVRKSKCGPRRMLFAILIILVVAFLVYSALYVKQGAVAIRASLSRRRQPEQQAPPPPPPSPEIVVEAPEPEEVEPTQETTPEEDEIVEQ